MLQQLSLFLLLCFAEQRSQRPVEQWQLQEANTFQSTWSVQVSTLQVREVASGDQLSTPLGRKACQLSLALCPPLQLMLQSSMERPRLVPSLAMHCSLQTLPPWAPQVTPPPMPSLPFEQP